MPHPEAAAREEIDRQLGRAGWLVQDYADMNITAGPGVAVREYPLKTGTADYLLYVDGKVAGVVEAKPEGYGLKGVEIQSKKYAEGLPGGVPSHCGRPVFAYESTGTVTQFTDGLDPHPRSREVFTFHQPVELARLADMEKQLRARLQGLPAEELVKEHLWPAQVTAVENLERSLAENRPRALIQMATGSGKTFTACTFSYRLLRFAKAKRILFLVDRNNLGRQTLTEFQQAFSPYTAYSFTEEYPTQQLRANTIESASKLVITTIQRLYSILKGEEEYDPEAEEGSMFESGIDLLRKDPVPVAYNPSVPIETFDFIVIDECHRSIYNVWRQVLDYFDAFLIGLTATPTAQTIGFFNGNLIQDYSHDKAVADGVNVDFDVYRIRTYVTEKGATLEADPEVLVPYRDKRTKETRYRELDDDLTYTAGELDRDVVSEDQIRLVAWTFRDRLFKDIFPKRTEVPKTLVFAKTDQHAEDIVRIMREEFGKGNEFCQKITSKTTGKKPEDLLNEFRNSYHPRIAVTVDMIATGTDVKALECLLFMRNIQSATYFEQMKGRGVRVIDPNDLHHVTPDAAHKTHFVIVDAVGVTEQDKTESKPLDRKPSVPLEKLLDSVAKGMANEDIASSLAARLARLSEEVDPESEAEIEDEADGRNLGDLAGSLLSSIDPDEMPARAREMFDLTEKDEPTEEQLAQAEEEAIGEALTPFHTPKLRDAILTAKGRAEQLIDEITKDTLIGAGYDPEARKKAETLVADFQRFVEEHKDEIEAIEILYSRPYRAGLRYPQVKELATELRKHLPLLPDHPEEPLWTAYHQLEPEKVKGEASALVDLVALVRYALDPDGFLIPVKETVEARYEEWLEEKEAEGAEFSKEQLKWLSAIKDHMATSLTIDRTSLNDIPFSQHGGLGRAYDLFEEDLDAILSEMNERVAV